MYGRQLVKDLPPTAYAPGENGETLHAKLAELTDLVEVHTAEAAEEQRQQCNKHSEERSSKWMIQSGCLYQLLGSWTHDGKETG